MKKKRNLKLIIAISAAVLLSLFVFISTGYFFVGRFEMISDLYSTNSVQASDQQLITNPSNEEEAVLAENDVEESEERQFLDLEDQYVNQSVYSIINLKFLDQVYVINSSDIELMLGHSTNLAEAAENFERFGEDGIKTVIVSAFDGADYDKKVFQKNRHGIDKENIRGFEYYESKYGPDYDDATKEVMRVVESRLALNSGNQDHVKVKRVYHPGTNGEYSNEKYIELDHSDQVIYAWDEGVMYKKWDASGFYDEYAVYGVFDLINKSDRAWSPIAEKWMPYWMAFYFAPDQQAWFGIHELVYWYDAEGNKIEESSDSIGQKKSGGCVRLDRGQMEQLYNWSEIGIHFLIYE